MMGISKTTARAMGAKGIVRMRHLDGQPVRPFRQIGELRGWH